MIFKGLAVNMRMKSATFGCAAVDSVEESLGADRKMVAAGVKMVGGASQPSPYAPKRQLP